MVQTDARGETGATMEGMGEEKGILPERSEWFRSRGIIGTAEGCSVYNGWVIDRSGECALCRRLFLYLYAISPLESADVLFYARSLDAADIWKEKKPHFFRV